MLSIYFCQVILSGQKACVCLKPFCQVVLSDQIAYVLQHIGTPDKCASIKLDRNKLTMLADKHMSIKLYKNANLTKLTKLTKPNGQVKKYLVEEQVKRPRRSHREHGMGTNRQMKQMMYQSKSFSRPNSMSSLVSKIMQLCQPSKRLGKF